MATLSYHTPFSPLTQILILGAITPTLSALFARTILSSRHSLPDLPYQSSFFISCTYLWNRLPDSIVGAPTTVLFTGKC